MSVHRRKGTALAVVGTVLFTLVACTTDPPPSRPTPVRTPSIAPVTPSATPTPTAASNDYAGPSPMPAADGGPMLWVAMVYRTVAGGEWRPRFGFADVTGNLVVPPRYSDYEYCRDASGRATLVLATHETDQVDVLDLTGAVVTRVPGSKASCAGDSHAVFHTNVTYDPPDFEPRGVGVGLFDLRTGKVVLPLKTERVIFPLNQETVNVREGNKEYFLDLATGRKTPHPGYIGQMTSSDVVPLDPLQYPSGPPWPAVAHSDSELSGYLDSSGRWALKPQQANTGPFREGYAIYGGMLVNTSLESVGETWNSTEAIGRFYEVTVRNADGVDLTGILDADLSRILDPVPGSFFCDSFGEQGACLIFSEGQPPRLVRLPEGSMVDLPREFTQMVDLPGELTHEHLKLLSPTLVRLGPWFNEDCADFDDCVFYNATTGIAFSLPAPDPPDSWDTPGHCESVGEDWISCGAGFGSALPNRVFTASGQRTAFRAIHSMPDATTTSPRTVLDYIPPIHWDNPTGDAPYYWAISGSYQGFVDASGRWLYRESRYTDLED